MSHRPVLALRAPLKDNSPDREKNHHRQDAHRAEEQHAGLFYLGRTGDNIIKFPCFEFTRRERGA
jgi:hypothetical protein